MSNEAKKPEVKPAVQEVVPVPEKDKRDIAAVAAQDYAEHEAKKGTEVVNWQEELKKLAVATADAEKPSGNWVSFKGGQLTIGGTAMKNNMVEAVVLHAIFENQMYESKYNPNNPQPPICYAFGDTDDDLKPHPESAKPQAANCRDCPNNQWGSDPEGGKGKACKNVRRLGLMSATDLDKVAKAEVAIAKLPVTSVKNWSTYANQVANALHLPPLGIITEMSVTPDPRYQLQVNFRLVDKVPEAHLPDLLKKRGEIHDLMYLPYDKPSEAAPPAQARKF